MNKVNTISNRSTVLVLSMYICTMPILCEHERLSAIMEWIQLDHSDCTHGRRVDDEPGTESFFANI